MSAERRWNTAFLGSGLGTGRGMGGGRGREVVRLATPAVVEPSVAKHLLVLPEVPAEEIQGIEAQDV